MEIVPILQSQYLASLAMLEEVVKQCPPSLWDDPQDTNPFWRVAFHTLLYTHLYLQHTEEDFQPWRSHHRDTQFLSLVLPESIYEPGQRAPFAPADILEYLELCREQVRQQLPTLDYDGPSGFDWLPFGKLELQIYTIRHLHHHIGELSERLAARAKVNELDWIGASADLMGTP